MWLKLTDGNTFNTAVAQCVKVGSAGDSEDANWAVIAEMPAGDDVVLAQYHLPQAAQEGLEKILHGLEHGKRFLDLT
jgi:hypothetical protein